MIDPEKELDDKERIELIQLMLSNGWKVLQRIMEQEVTKFSVALLNVDPGNTAKLVAEHARAKAAAQFVQGLVDRLNSEYEFHTTSLRPNVPYDPTDNALELEVHDGEEEV